MKEWCWIRDLTHCSNRCGTLDRHPRWSNKGWGSLKESFYFTFIRLVLVIDANCCGHKYKDWLEEGAESRSKEKWWEQWAKQSECILLLLWLISCIVFCLCGGPTHTKDRISQRDFWGSEKNNNREQRYNVFIFLWLK